MKKVSLLIFSLICAVSLQAATGIFGAYVTIGGTKYKSSASYAGTEATLGASSLGSFDVDTDSLIFSQGETLTYQYDNTNGNTHSTFAYAIAYRVRLAADSKSTNAGDYSFISMGDGSGIGGNDAKGEFTGGTTDFLAGIAAPVTETDYAVDIIHKIGAWEGGGNFERLANLNETDPGSTSWGATDAFTANFTVVPEPNAYALIAGMFGLAYIALKRRQA